MNRRRRQKYYGPGSAVRNRSISNIFFKQLLISIIIVLFIILVKQMDIAIVNKQLDNLEAHLSKELTGAELRNMASSSFQKIKDAPDTAISAFKEGTAKMDFSAPIDSVLNEKDKEFMIYSVGGGAVSRVSENKELGKFVEITHDNGVVSVYGMLNTINTKELNKVKKGQIIGSIENNGDNSLYFAILSDGKVVDPKDYIEF